MQVYDCRVNHLANPLGYQIKEPVFSWKVGGAAGKKQKAARILVSLKEDFSEAVLDTGWREDLDSLGTRMGMDGEAGLRPYTRYYWTVQVRSGQGEEASGELCWFETAKEKEPWEAKWIGCRSQEKRHPVFSKEFALSKEVEKARLYICGLGLYEAYINGRKAGDELLTPYSNNYHAWLQYQTYDVTELLTQASAAEEPEAQKPLAQESASRKQSGQGTAELEVWLGNGWYKGRFSYDDSTGKGYYGDDWKLIAELRVSYADGSSQVFGTDGSWQMRFGNITDSNLYDGEHVDDTLPREALQQAELMEAPEAPLCARLSTPVRVREELPAVELIRTPAGETVLDLGQNIAGSFRLRVKEPAGTRIRLQFGEILQQGNFYRDNLRTAKAEYTYISDGREHVLTPHFTFYGYRYVKVEGVPSLKKEDFSGLALYSELVQTGFLTTGNALVNRLILNTQWGQKGNFLDVPTDCPQRDERMGWTGDAQVFSATACYQMDSYAFFKKYLYDMATEQQAGEGRVPEVVPSFGHENTSCAWGDAACVIPWNLYRFYGDKQILEEQYGSMKAWVDYMTRVDGADNGWRRRFHFGDWLALDGPGGIDGVMGGTEAGFIASTYYRYSTQLLAKAARVLGKEEEASRYEALADRILDGIRQEYFSPLGRCCIDTQTGLLLTLRHGLSVNPKKTKEALVQKLKDNNGMLKTGFVGTPLLCEELTRMGRADMAYDLLLNEEYPGWLYEVKLGTTTIWERWNSVLADGSISSTGMNSLNHYAYGSIVEWIYSRCAGILQDEAHPGFRRVIFCPQVSRELGWVDARYDSASGTWRSSWRILDENHLEVKVSVPFGCSAELLLPLAPENLREREPGNPVFANVKDGKIYLEAGEYSISYETVKSMEKQEQEAAK